MRTFVLWICLALVWFGGLARAQETAVDEFLPYKQQLMDASIYRSSPPRQGESATDAELRVLKDAVERFRTRMLSVHTGGPTESEKVLLSQPKELRPILEAMRKDLRQLELQTKLVAAGALNNEPGEATLDEIEKAVLEFRRAIREPGAGPFTARELEILEKAKKDIEDFAKFEARKARTVRPAKEMVVLPLGLVPETGEGEDRSWTTYENKEIDLAVYHFVIPVKSLTPMRVANKLLEKRKGLSFERLDLTGDSFRIDGFALNGDKSGNEDFITFAGRELSGYVVGYGLRGPKNPPPGLSIPKVIVQKSAESRKAAQVLVLARAKEMASEAIDLKADQENWRAVVRIIRNLLGAKQAEFEYFKQIPRKECYGVTRHSGGMIKTAHIIYATGRKPVATLVPGPVELSNMFGAEQDKLLHVGCLEVEIRRRIVNNRPAKPTISARLLNVEEPYDLTKPKQIAFRRDGGPRLTRRNTSVELERALLYIHGYNNGFHDAVETVARIAAERSYEGQVFMFSWPSTQSWINYAPDMDFAEQGELHLSAFMKAILSSGNIQGLDVVAHSMGSQILLRSLESLRAKFDRRIGEENESIGIGQIVFAAPDVSSKVFAQKIIPFTQFAERVTVYASANDGVLDVSGAVRLGVPRAGYIKDGVPFAGEKVQVIDVTREKRPPYLVSRAVCAPHHSAFIKDPAVLADIADVLDQGISGSRLRSSEPDSRAKPEDQANPEFEAVPYPDIPPHQKPSKFWKLRADYGIEKNSVSRVERLMGDLCMQ